ncbi:putative diguanylate cyclase YdaM [Hartmannibacter diazotrophicus]|uniref:diguanylate cyclase n=1 Tax=Hartmannibacter diazotrophicus TaxID=1482074 RepID=A0A2C9DC76_9HYPH|nr:GGDEF domain-containing protein [Hartmannibacter diazotrophicus]SON57924.1 putative diguanylate cyclase YdaM [Hartmannibacter diazotrophicus]
MHDSPRLQDDVRPAAEHPVYWLSPAGLAVPPVFGSVMPFPVSQSGTRPDDVICLIGLGASNPERELREIRRQFGAAPYLLAVASLGLSTETRLRLIELDADDVIGDHSREDLLIALARADRVLAERRLSSLRIDRLERERAYLQASIDSLPPPIFFKDRAGIYLGCNKAFEAYIGLSAEQVVGSSVYDVAPQHLAQIYEQADDELMAAAGTQVYETQVRFADGSFRDVCFHKAALVFDGEHVEGLAGVMLDITKQKAFEAQLKEAAERDPLTGVYNRRKFMDVLDQRASAAASGDGHGFAVAVIDVDHFKRINDTFGHAAGDAVLCRIAEIGMTCCGEDDLFARAGGEEFYFLIDEPHGGRAEELAQALRLALSRICLGEGAIAPRVTASIGVAHFRPGREEVHETIRRADRALYSAKDAGRNQVMMAA